MEKLESDNLICTAVWANANNLGKGYSVKVFLNNTSKDNKKTFTIEYECEYAEETRKYKLGEYYTLDITK